MERKNAPKKKAPAKDKKAAKKKAADDEDEKPENTEPPEPPFLTMLRDQVRSERFETRMNSMNELEAL